MMSVAAVSASTSTVYLEATTGGTSLHIPDSIFRAFDTASTWLYAVLFGLVLGYIYAVLSGLCYHE